MNRHTEASLLEHCLQQNSGVNPDAWLRLAADPAGPSRDETCAAALFLAGVDWFADAQGRQQLQRIAQALQPGSVGHFGEVAGRAGFEPGRFSSLLKARLEHASH